MAALSEKQRKAIGLVGPSDEAVTSYCRQHGYELLTIHIGPDGRTSAIDEACEQKAILVAESLHQVADSMLEVARLGRRLRGAGAELALLDLRIDTVNRDRPQEDHVLQLLDAMAELEYERLADRLPYGYAVADDLVHVVAVPMEIGVIRQMIQWYHDSIAVDEIADRLNAKGIAPRKGSSWTNDDVQRVIDHAPTSRWEFAEEEAG